MRTGMSTLAMKRRGTGRTDALSPIVTDASVAISGATYNRPEVRKRVIGSLTGID